MTNYRNDAIDSLLAVIARMDSAEKLEAFFDDLCTIKELQDMAQRFQTAISLSEGKSYQEVSATVGTSTATISRVSRCLNYGGGGYKNAIDIFRGLENADK